jgi:HEAT repeat protein
MLSSRCVVLSVLGLMLLVPVAGARDGAIPEDLLKQIKDDNPDVRIKAIMGLSKLGAEAVPVLVEALKDKETNVGTVAAYGLLLIKLEPAERVAALRPFLADKSSAVRNGVAGALARGGPGAVEPLVGLLKDEAEDVRKTTVRSLQSVVQRDKEGKVGEAVVGELEKALQDESPGMRLAVVQALPFCGARAVPVLVTALDDREAKVRATAAAALSRPAYKMLAATILPALTKRLKREEELIVKQSLVSTLSRCGPEALPALREALADKAPEVQKVALTGLVKMGPPAKAALPAVKELAAKGRHPDVRKTAVSVLPQFGTEGLAAVLDLLKVEDSATRLGCLQVLGKQGGATATEVPSLTECLKDGDEDVRALAAYVLGKLGPEAKAALPALEKLRMDKDERVRAVAEKAVESIAGK